jgi:hypothetical protein
MPEHAMRCLGFVHMALIAAEQAQRVLRLDEAGDFDRRALHGAVGHLQRALDELRCFDPEAIPRNQARRRVV